MKRKISVLMVVLLLALLTLTGCRGARPLPEGMEEEAVGEAAREIVALLVDGNYQEVADSFRPEVKEEYSVTADTVKAMMDTVAEAGGYVKTTRTLVVGGDSKKFTEPYAATAVYCEHQSKDVIYEISFDADLKVIGLQVKQK